MEFYKLQVLLLTLPCSPHSFAIIHRSDWTTTVCETTDSNFYLIIKINSPRFLKSRVSYYYNSNATLQLCLLIAGYVNPNPGPVTNTLPKSGNQRITYIREKLLELKDFGKNMHIRPDVWNCIKLLKINSKPVTHRGKGSKLNRTRKRQNESTPSSINSTQLVLKINRTLEDCLMEVTRLSTQII